MSDSTRPGTTIQSVSRAMHVLLAIARNEHPMTPKELSGSLGLTLPTTYHLLATLEMEGMLARDGRRAYMLGPAASVIADSIGHDYAAPHAYREALRELAERTGEAVYLSAWRQGAMRILESIEGKHAVGVTTLPVGYTTHVHARASSKLLLAFAPVQLRERVIEGLDFVVLTPHTITSVDRLLIELDTIRHTGLSFDRGEVHEGVECVAVPVRLGESVVASLAIQAPLDRFRRNEDEIVAIAREVASRIGAIA